MSEMENEHIEPPVAATRRTWLRGLVLGTSLLVMGGVIGSSLTVMAIKQQRDAERQRGRNMAKTLVERLTSEMDLNASQTEQINGIVSRHHETIRGLHTDFRKEAHSEMRRMKDDIAAVLTDDQRVLWDKRWEEKMKKRRESYNREGRGDRSREGDDRAVEPLNTDNEPKPD